MQAPSLAGYEPLTTVAKKSPVTGEFIEYLAAAAIYATNCSSRLITYQRTARFGVSVG